MATTTSETQSGSVLFATTLFFVLGAINLIHGIAVLANAEWIVFTPSGAWLLDFSTWGWVNLILGLVQVVVGWGLMTRSEWARVTGIVLAMFGCIIAIFTIPMYATWGILAFALSLIVLYSLSANPFVE